MDQDRTGMQNSPELLNCISHTVCIGEPMLVKWGYILFMRISLLFDFVHAKMDIKRLEKLIIGRNKSYTTRSVALQGRYTLTR